MKIEKVYRLLGLVNLFPFFPCPLFGWRDCDGILEFSILAGKRIIGMSRCPAYNSCQHPHCNLGSETLRLRNMVYFGFF